MTADNSEPQCVSGTLLTIDESGELQREAAVDIESINIEQSSLEDHPGQPFVIKICQSNKLLEHIPISGLKISSTTS